MKKYIKIITIVVIFALFTLPVAANEVPEGYLSEFDGILPEGYEDFSDADKLSSLVGIDALLSVIIGAVTGEGTALGAFFLLLLGTLALSHLAAAFKTPLSDTVDAAVSTVSALLVFGALFPVFSEAMQTVTALSSFFSLAVPIMTGITLAGGGVASSAVQAVGMNFTVSIVGALASRAFVCVAAFAFSLGLISSFGDEGAAALSRGVRSVFGWLLGIVTALVVGALSLQTVISSATDSAAMRAAKYAAQGIIPVVGGTVSGALSTLATGLSYAKDIIGSGAIGVMLVSSLSPLVVMLLYRLALSVAASLADTLSSGGAMRSLSAFRFAADTVIALYSLSVLTYIFEIILFMKGGVGVV